MGQRETEISEELIQVIDLREVVSQSGSVPLRRTSWDEQQRETERELLLQLIDDDTTDDVREPVTHQVVLMHTKLVEHIARKFRDRGEPLEDLVQVGMIGLIKAVGRFDPLRGFEFSTYATATITGEIKRHFRDKTWAVHMPRRLQELRHSVAHTTSALAHDLGRPPTVAEIAAALNMDIAEVIEGQQCAQAYQALSLDAITDAVGTDELSQFTHLDESMELVEVRHMVTPLIKRLPPRQQRVVVLRFFYGWSQSAIADDIGVSQMHVSRLLNQSITQLRAWLGERRS
jgi:RNA polymerase sigma-B factor